MNLHKPCCHNLDLVSMTLKLERDLDILKMHYHTNNEVGTSRNSKVESQNFRNTKTALRLKVKDSSAQ